MKDLERVNQDAIDRVRVPNETYAKMQEEHRRAGIFGDSVWAEPIKFAVLELPVRVPLRYRFWRWIGEALIEAGCWCRDIDRDDLYL